MGNHALAVPNFNATIETKDKQKFQIAYADLIDHILLLRRVIAHPEMTQEGPVLNYYIQDYCKRMGQKEMATAKQQLKLPWQVEWIWHVHRLHPLNYDKDCKAFGNGEVVDKKVYNLIQTYNKKHKAKPEFTSTKNHSSFFSSVDLVQAVIRQRDFLEKFQQHSFFSHTFTRADRSNFEQLVQNYVSFLKLARKNEMIIPTYDIDLVWHSHMRRPVHYQTCCLAMCGFVLDHDDAIEKHALSDNYQKTADRWKKTYNVAYGQNVDRNHIESSHYISSCAMVFIPIITTSCGGHASCGAIGGGCDTICGGGGGSCDGGGASCGGGGGASCGGGGGASCGGGGSSCGGGGSSCGGGGSSCGGGGGCGGGGD